MNATAHLWTAKANGDPAARDALVREHLSLVHHVAQQLARSLSTELDAEELVGAGTLGLIQAIEAFDPARGLAFSTLAVPRVRGAMLDELRRLDHVPRSLRRRGRDLAQARETLGRRLGRAPNDNELAEELGIDKLTLWKWQADLEAGIQVPLERSSTEEGDTPGYGEWETAAADETPSIEDTLTAEAEQSMLREALTQLKEQERTVLALYYYEELKMHQIASVLGLTESRVSQIRTRAIVKLREVMAPARSTAGAPELAAMPVPRARRSTGARQATL